MIWSFTRIQDIIARLKFNARTGELLSDPGIKTEKPILQAIN